MKKLLNNCDARVADTGYTYMDFTNTEDGEVKALANLDEVVSKKPITFQLSYPFDGGIYNGKIVKDEGITLRDIIDAIRAGFGVMYKDATVKPMAGLINMSVDSDDYGHAFHAIEDLYIEGLEYDEKASTLKIIIGS